MSYFPRVELSSFGRSNVESKSSPYSTSRCFVFPLAWLCIVAGKFVGSRRDAFSRFLCQQRRLFYYSRKIAAQVGENSGLFRYFHTDSRCNKTTGIRDIIVVSPVVQRASKATKKLSSLKNQLNSGPEVCQTVAFSDVPNIGVVFAVASEIPCAYESCAKRLK